MEPSVHRIRAFLRADVERKIAANVVEPGGTVKQTFRRHAFLLLILSRRLPPCSFAVYFRNTCHLRIGTLSPWLTNTPAYLAIFRTRVRAHPSCLASNASIAPSPRFTSRQSHDFPLDFRRLLSRSRAARFRIQLRPF